MKNWKRLLIIILLAVLGLAVLLLGAGVLFTDLIVDFWWHSEMGLGGFFWLKLLYRYILFGVVTAFFFLIFFLNFWAASRYLGTDADSFARLGRAEGSRREQLLHLFQTGSMKVYVPLSLILAIVIAIPFYKDWHAALLFIFGPAAGAKDFVFGQDISFFLFSYPVFQLIQREMLIAAVILAIAIALLYWIEHRIAEQGKEWARGARVHLSGLVIVTALIVAWGFMLDRYQLLYTEAHEPQFFGPGFVEIYYHLPIIWLSIISLIGTVLAGLWFIHRRQGLLFALTLGLVFLATLGVRYVAAIPAAIDRFVVKPNPVKTERQYMKNNIDSTLAAYDLTHITNLDIIPGLPDEDVLDPELRTHLYNIPVWDPEFLDDVYQQLQGIRPYYHFTDVDTDRYMINGRLEQVNLAARETNISLLPPAAQNWENTHLRYTHGYGAVVTPAAQDGQTPMHWYLQDLTMQTSNAFNAVERPDIYYGEENLSYAIVPNKLEIVGIPSADEASSFNYTGSGGVPISSLFRKLLFALYFRDEKLFFSVNITGESKALFHRNIVDRVRTLTPFLNFSHDPYIVITPKRIFWIIDAYTISDWYPVSKRSTVRFNRDEDEQQFNYIRNSVKVVIDAFDGHVDYYVNDTSDPIIRGYRNAYPGIFKDMDTLPPLLKEHLRYPKDMFVNQMKIYARYHQQEPELFYEQAETWEFAKVNDAIVKPYFLTTKLEGYQSDRQNFVLLNPMTPVGRSNLSVLAVAGRFGPGAQPQPGQTNGKQIIMYRFSRESQVEGPAQVSALIDQDPEIARQLTLWDQRGSRVLRGRIIVLPVGRSVLYVQPVYIVSTSGTRIPELQRIILSMGNVVVMNASLEEGIVELEKRLKVMRESSPGRLPAAKKPVAPASGPSFSPM
ncbi:MAG: UPF0182 family protein [Methylococcaceae bacterium]|nr:UPF0182 family protein [Methylococcaceae bacterium]